MESSKSIYDFTNVEKTIEQLGTPRLLVIMIDKSKIDPGTGFIHDLKEILDTKGDIIHYNMNEYDSSPEFSEIIEKDTIYLIEDRNLSWIRDNSQIIKWEISRGLKGSILIVVYDTLNQNDPLADSVMDKSIILSQF